MKEPLRRDELQGEIIHVYDGIEEADNALPRWWLFTFYGSVAFAVLYWFAYHAYGSAPLPLAEYEIEQERLAEAGGFDLSDDELVALAADTTTIARGRQTFTQSCVACHGPNGEGAIGPNLTDGSWIHGGAPSAILSTVRNGVLAKGMPQWGPMLGVRATTSVVAYVLSIRDTNLPGKAPEGEPYSPPEVTASNTPAP